uniref:Vitamin D-binding protein n=1 Tax=Serinus canaria TaxID=9135 RepID=A0A8C9MLY1_SERCA
MVSTCCTSPAPTACFLKEVRPLGVLGSPPCSLPHREPGKRCAHSHFHSLFVAETGEEKHLPTHPDVKPDLLPLLGLRQGQSQLQVRGEWPLHPGTGLGCARAPLSCCRSCWQAAFRKTNFSPAAVDPCSCLVHSTGTEQSLPSPSSPSLTLLRAGSWEGIQAPSPTLPVLPSSLASLAQKVPSASFEDLLPLAEDAAEVASHCCDSMAEDCMQRKLLEHTARVCSVLSARDGRFASCCQGKNLMENHFCILAMPPAPAPRLPEPPEPTGKELCAKEGALHATRFLFELARRHPSLPEAVLAKLYDSSGKLRRECCSSKDPSACWGSKRQRIQAELFPFLAKADQLCGQYHKLPFLEFKKRLRDSLAQAEPSPAQLEQLLEQRASFASSCCLPDSPPLLCASKVSSELGELCQGDSCLLG